MAGEKDQVTDDLGPEKFGARLRRIREQHGLSIARLAQRSGITQGYLSQIEAGKRPTPGIGTLVSLASAFRISLDELTGFDPSALPPEEAPAETRARLDSLERAVLRLAQDTKKGFEEIRQHLASPAGQQQPASRSRRPRGPGK